MWRRKGSKSSGSSSLFSAERRDSATLIAEAEKRYLVDQKWLKQWKKYVGFDSWEQLSAGRESANPGPADNSNLFKCGTHVLKDHLMEEQDYALLPKPAWEKLSKWYGMSAGSRPIIRKVVEYGTYVKHLKVEVYLIELRLCVYPHVKETKIQYFSRADLAEYLQKEVLKIFELPEDLECRLWQRYMTNSYELLNNPKQSLTEASVYGGQLIMLEVKLLDGTWPRDQSTTHDQVTHTQWNSGLCGLTNLGNTCFMNSALQCLSNTQPLTEYFIGREKEGKKLYKRHINRDNPLGMGGALADTYGQLLEEMWNGNASYVVPCQFKTMIGRHAPQFSGKEQQDSQKLLAFLLNGLHEELNLVRQKPHIDMDIQTHGREDKDIAKETWYKYQLQNQSAIVQLFQGLQKSALDCHGCQKTSVTFEPFMCLSLPLPAERRYMTVLVVRADPSVPITKVRVSVPKTGSVLHLKETLQKTIDVHVDSNKLVAVDVFRSRFHRVYHDKDPVSHILDRDDIYFYELRYPIGDPEWVPVPVYHREVRESQSYTGMTTVGSVFGLPLVVSVPQKGCKYQMLRHYILTQCSRYVKIPQGHPWNQEQSENFMQRESQLKKIHSDKNDLFYLVTVNSCGSQVVKHFANDDTLLQLSRNTYVSCEWRKDVAEAYYNTDVAEEIVSHKSCHSCDEGKNPITVYSCIELYAEKEVLEKEDAGVCPHCKEVIKASKKLDLWKMPEILVIFFKRFSHTMHFRNKLEMYIDFPINGLDLSNYIINQDEPQPVYDLFAISNHIGSLDKGHYTTYAKNKMTRNWYCFDDSHVQEVKNLEHMVTSSAYMLFYQRRTGGLRDPPQHNQLLSTLYIEEMRERGKEFRGGLSVNSDSMEVSAKQ